MIVIAIGLSVVAGLVLFVLAVDEEDQGWKHLVACVAALVLAIGVAMTWKAGADSGCRSVAPDGVEGLYGDDECVFRVPAGDWQPMGEFDE